MIKPEGIIVHASPYSSNITIQRFRETITSMGMTVFATIDFAADAQKSGLTLDDSVLLVFGNPKLGTLLLQEAPHAGIDLPLKAFSWTREGKHWLSYNDPAYIARRHGITDDATISKMSEALLHAATTTVLQENKINKRREK